MAELTVRETLDFSRRVQGAGSRTCAPFLTVTPSCTAAAVELQLELPALPALKLAARRRASMHAVGAACHRKACNACAAELERLKQAEKEQGIKPDPYLAAFMKANTLEGKRESIHTEYLLRTMGLGVCSDTQARAQLPRAWLHACLLPP